MDKDGIIRISGWLLNAQLPINAKQPMKAHLAKIILQHLHNLHVHTSARVKLAIMSEIDCVAGLRSIGRQVATLPWII